MDPCDAEKIAFQTSMGNFNYTVMSFGLKITVVTYQCAMSTIFQDIFHVSWGLCWWYRHKVSRSQQHIDDLWKVFLRCRHCNLRTSTLKITVKSSLGKVSYILTSIPALVELLVPSKSFWRRMYHLDGRGVASSFPKGQECDGFISNHDITVAGFAVNPLFDLDQQIYLCIKSTRGRGDQAPFRRE